MREDREASWERKLEHLLKQEGVNHHQRGGKCSERLSSITGLVIPDDDDLQGSHRARSANGCNKFPVFFLLLGPSLISAVMSEAGQKASWSLTLWTVSSLQSKYNVLIGVFVWSFLFRVVASTPQDRLRNSPAPRRPGGRRGLQDLSSRLTDVWSSVWKEVGGGEGRPASHTQALSSLFSPCSLK